MRLLLDEHLPHPLADRFEGHEVHTVHSQGWAGLKNGELLRRASKESFDAFITSDRNLEFQQNLVALPFGIVVLEGRSNDLDDLDHLLPAAREALTSIGPGQVVHIAG